MSGPSAVGKDAIIRCLMKMDLPLVRILNTTTRPKRPKEIAGLHYNFVTREQFETMISKGEMMEWNEYDEHLYGTQRSEFVRAQKLNKYPLWELDPTTAVKLLPDLENAISIFITPSSWSILRTRLEKRGMPEHDIRIRLRTGHREIKLAPKFDYRIINYNGQLKNVAKEVADIMRHHLAL